MPEIRMIPLDLIILDPDCQCRVTIDPDTTAQYGEAMEDGCTFPPVTVFDASEGIYLVDGWHRYEAALRIGWTEIACEVHQGSKADAIWCAVGTNATHGKRRSRDETNRAIERALKHPRAAGVSDRKLAAHVGTSATQVAKVRKMLESTAQIGQSNLRTGADGRTIDVTKIGKGRSHAEGTPVALPAQEEPPAHIQSVVDEPEAVDSDAPSSEPPGPTTGEHCDCGGIWENDGHGERFCPKCLADHPDNPPRAVPMPRPARSPIRGFLELPEGLSDTYRHLAKLERKVEAWSQEVGYCAIFASIRDATDKIGRWLTQSYEESKSRSTQGSLELARLEFERHGKLLARTGAWAARAANFQYFEALQPRAEQLQGHIDAATQLLREAYPVACPHCGGAESDAPSCAACRGRGWVDSATTQKMKGAA